MLSIGPYQSRDSGIHHVMLIDKPAIDLIFQMSEAASFRTLVRRAVLPRRPALQEMSEAGLLRKDQLEASLHKEKKLIEDGVLKEDNPLDVSESFRKLCEACRRNDLKVCQEMITEGANINARDPYDYTPLILVSFTLSISEIRFVSLTWNVSEAMFTDSGSILASA